MADQPWPITLTVDVAWAEMDAFGHVNNTVYLRWFESARIMYFEKLGVATTIAPDAKAWPLLAHSSIDYRAKVVYPDRVEIAARVTKLGNTSFTMAYRATSLQQQRLVAEGVGVVVMVTPKTGTKVPLDPELRAKISALEGI
jgi:acyl-CoA thioester hydrolase